MDEIHLAVDALHAVFPPPAGPGSAGPQQVQEVLREPVRPWAGREYVNARARARGRTGRGIAPGGHQVLVALPGIDGVRRATDLADGLSGLVRAVATT
ncbi:hypothetical protein ILP97_18365 [Amycolatopsis sp. H6(2020)]|nr:hypothetical protein [Amycolatopsis sp. H6(2020)]